MSLEDHVLCQRMLIGPCALTTLGAATVVAAATAAPLKNWRRALLSPAGVFALVIIASQKRGPPCPRQKLYSTTAQAKTARGGVLAAVEHVVVDRILERTASPRHRDQVLDHQPAAAP